MKTPTTGRTGATSGRATIKDIARVVGVSSSTVARALNDNARISDGTKLRVRAAARDLGYVVHSAARLMRGESSTVIGLTVPDIENDFYATLARAVAEVCRDSGFQLVLSITEDDPEAEFHHLRALVGAQAAGAVVVPTATPLPGSVSLMERLPVAQLIRHSPALKSDWFTIDDERGIREATEHLIALGHDRIGYIGASDEFSTGTDRLNGYRSALATAGIAERPQMIALGAPRPPFAFAAFKTLLERSRPTAVISGGSQITVGIIQAISAIGLSVPRDISFFGYGDSPLYDSWAPRLTTIGLPVREIALAGSAALIRRIRRLDDRHTTPDSGSHGALFLPRLMIRQSTAAPVPAAPEVAL